MKKKYKILYIQPIGSFSGSQKFRGIFKNLMNLILFFTQKVMLKYFENIDKYLKLLEHANMIILKIVITRV